MTASKWRCFLDGWDITDFVDPSGGYSVASPAEEIVFKGDAMERTILCHYVRSHPGEGRYIVVAGYRKPGTDPYMDGEGKQVVDVDVVPAEDRPVVRAMLADAGRGQDVRFYGE